MVLQAQRGRETAVSHEGNALKTHQRVQYESISEPLDDEERALMDPDAWDWDNPVEVSVAEHPLAQLPIDFTFDELKIIEHVARAAGMSPHAFVKRAALAAARAR